MAASYESANAGSGASVAAIASEAERETASRRRNIGARIHALSALYLLSQLVEGAEPGDARRYRVERAAAGPDVDRARH